MGRRRSDSGNRLSVEDHREIQRRVTEGETFALDAATLGKRYLEALIPTGGGV